MGMHHNFSLLLAGLGIAVLSVVADDKNDEAKKEKAQKALLEEAAQKLDKIEKHVEEWGHASVSQVILLENKAGSNGGKFKIDYENKTAVYVDAVRSNRQGSATIFTERELANELSLEIKNDKLGQINDEIQIVKKQAELEKARQELASARAGGNQFTTSNSVITTTSVTTNAATNNTTNATTNTTSASNSDKAGSASADADKEKSKGEGADGKKDDGAKASKPMQTENPISDAFKDPGNLINNFKPEISYSDALKAGASHKVLERLLNFMADPADLPDGWKAYFGIMQVSVSPGWRTKEDYICEVQVAFEYATTKTNLLASASTNTAVTNALKSIKSRYLKENDKTEFSDIIPFWINAKSVLGQSYSQTNQLSVVAAFPMAEAQVFDLKNYFRSQVAFYASLAGYLKSQGMDAQATEMFRYTKRLQSDLGTANVFPLVVPSPSASTVTYRFDPEIRAILDPASRSSDAGRALNPTTFPALVVVVVPREETEVWSHLGVHVETRWIPRAKRHWFKKGAVDWWLKSAPPVLKRFSNEDRLKDALTLDELLKSMGGFDPGSYLYQEVRRRYANIRASALGESTYFPLERKVQAPAPTIVAVSPGIAPAKEEFNFVISGANFMVEERPVVASVLLGGRKCTFKVVSKNVIVATAPAFLPADSKEAFTNGRVDLTVTTEGGAISMPSAVGITTEVALQKAVVPAITSVQPARGLKWQASKFTIIGTGFNPANSTVQIGGLDVNVLAGGTEKMLQVSVPFPLPPQLQQFSLADKKAAVSVRTPTGTAFLQDAVYFDLQSPAEDAAAVAPTISSVKPDRGYLYAESTFVIKGSNFMRGSVPWVKRVTIGARNCQFEVISDKIIIATMPAWAEPNDLSEFTAGNRATVVVATPGDLGELPNAVYFDLKVPKP